MSGYMPPHRHIVPETDPAKLPSDIRSRSHYEAMAWLAQCRPTISPTALRLAHPNPDVAEVIVYNNGGRLPPPPPTRPTPRDLPNPPSPVLGKAPVIAAVVWLALILALSIGVAVTWPAPPHQSQPEPPTSRPLEPCR